MITLIVIKEKDKIGPNVEVLFGSKANFACIKHELSKVDLGCCLQIQRWLVSGRCLNVR